MHTIRIRKAKSGDGFKFKYRLVEKKKDLTIVQAKKFAVKKNYKFEASKNLLSKDFKLAISKLIPAQPVLKSAPKEAVKKKVTTIPKSAARNKVNKKLSAGFQVHSRVGSQRVLEGEQLILDELEKAGEALTASEIGKRIFRDELNNKGVEFVVEIRGFKFYAYLNKHYTPMVKKGLVKVTGLIKGHRKMEKLWEAKNVV